MLLSELSNFIRNHIHLKVPTEVGVSDIARCNNDVPKYLVLKSLNDVKFALFRGSPLLYAVGPHRLQYLFVQHQLIVYRQARSSSHEPRGELSYLVPLGSEKISAPYFKQCFFQEGGLLPPRQSNTTLPSPKTEVTNILFYILNFASIIKFKM